MPACNCLARTLNVHERIKHLPASPSSGQVQALHGYCSPRIQPHTACCACCAVLQGPEYSARLVGVRDMPKGASRLSLDFSSLLGPLFMM